MNAVDCAHATASLETSAPHSIPRGQPPIAPRSTDQTSAKWLFARKQGSHLSAHSSAGGSCGCASWKVDLCEDFLSGNEHCPARTDTGHFRTSSAHEPPLSET